MDATESLQALDALAIPAAQGRRAGAIAMAYQRDLTDLDVQTMLSGAMQAAPVPALATLRHAHHHVARLFAEGKKPYEVSARTGYTGAWLSTLQQDPAFRELVQYYSGEVEDQFVDYHGRLASLGTHAVEVLQERLLEKPQQFTNRELREIMESAYDRSVAPGKGQVSPGGASASLTAIQVTFVTPEAVAPAQAQKPGANVVIDVEPEA